MALGRRVSRPFAVAAVGFALVATGCGGKAEQPRAAGAHFSDATGDAGGLPDIRSIEVTSTPTGRISFRVSLGQLTARTKTGVDLWLDADADPETGNTTFHDADGADYLLSEFIGFKPPQNELAFCGRTDVGNGCFSKWGRNGWFAADAPTARVGRTATAVTFSINQSDLGNTDDFNFFVVRGGGPPAFPDRAPGTGTFSYSLRQGGAATETSSPTTGGRSNKAGGKSARKPVVLTFASHEYPPVTEASAFAAAVKRLSGGSLRIDVKYGYRYYDIEYERGTIADVRQDAIDSAVVGARAWDAVGVTSFRALVAPFLVDSYALERRVLDSSIPQRTLAGVNRLGLVGIAVLPGELRRPLGLSRPLVRPENYKGALIGIRPGGVASATFEALGGRAKGFRAGPTGLSGFDGAESGVATIQNNGYDRHARALTANVVLWPRATTIVVNRRAFDALSTDEQDTVRRAGAEIVEPILETTQANEAAALDAICRGSRLPLVTASEADRAALRRATRPVYDRLERDPLTRELIAEIVRMRRDEGATTQTLRCPRVSPRTAPAVLQGLWRLDVTRKELRAAGAVQEQLDVYEGSWTLELKSGRWIGRNLKSGNVFRGTYAARGDVLTLTVASCRPAKICTPGHVDAYTWSVYRDKLSLRRIPGRAFNVAVIAKPLTRVG
jgi:TRAP-type C4-dicarboxylate transport system substrate-binding protein